MLHFSKRALTRAFSRHSQCGDPRAHSTNDSYLLLRVYALECGLKALLLKQRGLHTTSRLADDDLTHELDVLLRRVGAAIYIGNVEAQEPQGVQVSPGQVHEVLRYGGQIKSSARTRLTPRVDEVLRWIEENL